MWLFITLVTFFGPVGASSDTFGHTYPAIFSRECYDDTFCIESVEEDGRVDLFVSKLVPWDFTLVVDLQMENMTSDKPLPFVRTFASRGREQIMKLSVAQRGRTWSFHFNLRWVLGALEARHDDRAIYTLPYARDESYRVAQGYNGSATHAGKNAIDFELPVGTGVRAARDGIVVDVEESFYEGSFDPSLKSQANYVKIRHSDGTIGHYVHLMQNGVRVYKGDRVQSGDLIAYSGDTGFSSGPHLHFEVYTISQSLTQKTIPVRFRANGRNDVMLRVGTRYGH
jgi:murein DD-endopeptidase MepM/ murein hydrolase activator NlpD